MAKSCESGLVEHIVGLPDREHSGGAPPSAAAEFNNQLATIIGPDPNRPCFTEAQLSRVRDRIEELHHQWAGVPTGSTLDLVFIA